MTNEAGRAESEEAQVSETPKACPFCGSAAESIIQRIEWRDVSYARCPVGACPGHVWSMLAAWHLRAPLRLPKEALEIIADAFGVDWDRPVGALLANARVALRPYGIEVEDESA